MWHATIGQRHLSGYTREICYFSSPWLCLPCQLDNSRQVRLTFRHHKWLSTEEGNWRINRGAVYWHNVFTKVHSVTTCLNSACCQEQQKSEEPLQKYLIPQMGSFGKIRMLVKKKLIEVAKKPS